jgi:hypothetical protein
MTTADVGGKPLNIMIDVFLAGSNESVTSNNQYTQTKDPIQQVLPFAPASLKNALSGLLAGLNEPLGVIFNTNWLAAQGKEQTAAAKAFTTQANSGGSSVSQVSCSLPPIGNVIATVTDASGSQPGFLFLDFKLAGQGFFHFYSGPLGAGWKLDFNADLVIQTPVPVKPFGFNPLVQASLSNAQMHADNFGADLDEGLDDFFTALGNFFLQTDNYVSDVDWEENLAQQEVDNQTATITSSAVAPIVSFFTELNNAGPQCLAFGFTECAFSIAGGQLTLTVSHPLDAAPQLFNAQQLPGEITLSPQMSATASEALPGQAVTIDGIWFPLDTSTQINLQWNNTSSGTATQAQVRWNNQNQTIQTPAGFNGTYTYAATGLTPGKDVSFIARCGDQLTWSEWSKPLVATALESDLVDMSLIPTGGGATQIFDLGLKPLSKTSTNFTFAAQIPVGAPPGPYNLSATLNGQVLCTTPIEIVTTLAPVVDVIDPSTGIVGDAPIFGGMPFTLRGEGFPDGPVTIDINGAPVATPTAVNGDFKVQLNTPGNQWTVGVFPLTATGGAATATLNPPIELEGAPQ